MAMNEIKSCVSELLETAVDSVFEQMQDRLGITSGDVPPWDFMVLDNAQEKLADVIGDILIAQASGQYDGYRV